MTGHNLTSLSKGNEFNHLEPIDLLQLPNRPEAEFALVVKDQFAFSGLHQEMVGPEGFEPPTKRL